MRLYKIVLIVLSLFIFIGCTNSIQPSIKKIDDNETFKYIRQYEDEHSKIKEQNITLKPSFRWIQPKNKKESCKIYVSIDSLDDKTTKSDYEFYWDGDCKDGYAHGLGREIEKTVFTTTEQIGYYTNGKANGYCSKSIGNKLIEGECYEDEKKAYLAVITTISDSINNFNITFENGLLSAISSPFTGVMYSPFDGNKKYLKVYSNFAYLVTDFSENSADNRFFEFNTYNKDIKQHGYSLVVGKKHSFLYGYEYKNNIKQAEKVKPSYNYYLKAFEIHDEAKKYSDLAIQAQAKALIIKQKYKNKICVDSLNSDFMNNNEYKAICKEEEKNAEIKTRIATKVAQIVEQRRIEEKQQNEQRLIQAQEVQAIAAQRKAEAVEDANLNQRLQNTNFNNQMQQLNNNLFMMRMGY